MTEELDLEEFENDLKIDPISIGDEWMRVPTLVQKYGKLVANAANKKERLKTKLETTKALLDFDIRNNPGNYDNIPKDPKTGLPKLTETVIANAVILEQKYININEERMSAIYEHASTKVLFDSIEAKVKAMDNITKLVLAGWYGEFKGGDQEGLTYAVNKAVEDFQEKNKIKTVEKHERKILKRSPLKKR